MDRAGCYAGFATDHVFLYEDDFMPYMCDVSMTFYVAFFSLLSLVRFGIVILQFNIWRYRTGKATERDANRNHEIPVLVILSLISSVGLVLFTILTSLNIANAANGLPGFLLSVLYTPFVITFSFHYEVITRSGKRLLSLSKMPEMKKNLEISQRLAKLSEATILSKYVMVLSGLIAAASFLAGLARPVSMTYEVGAGAYAVPDIVISLGFIAQYQRLILATKKRREFTAEHSKMDERALDAAIRKFRLNQVFYSVTGLLGAGVWLVTASRATVPRYWFAMIYFGLEVFTTGYLTVISVPTEWTPLLFRSHSRLATSDDDSHVLVSPLSATVTDMASSSWRTALHPDYTTMLLPRSDETSS